jgi:hypothetical protein
MAQARVLPAQATATEPVAQVNRGVELSDKPVEEMTSFAGQDLRDEPIPQVTLIGANFEGAILKRCDFSKRDLSHADFRDADLYRAVFKETNLYTTNFRGADLTRADFRGARLYGVNIYDADVTRAVFDETVIEEKDGDFSKAADVYITLNRVLKENGDVERAAAYYYRQRVCQRRTRASQLSALLERIFFDWLVGYGEKPIRTVYAAILTIVACAPTSPAWSCFPRVGPGPRRRRPGESADTREAADRARTEPHRLRRGRHEHLAPDRLGTHAYGRGSAARRDPASGDTDRIQSEGDQRLRKALRRIDTCTPEECDG